MMRRTLVLAALLACITVGIAAAVSPHPQLRQLKFRTSANTVTGHEDVATGASLNGPFTVDTLAPIDMRDWDWLSSLKKETSTAVYHVGKLLIWTNGTVVDTDSLYYAFDLSWNQTTWQSQADFTAVAFGANNSTLVSIPLLADWIAQPGADGGIVLVPWMRVRLRSDSDSTSVFPAANVALANYLWLR